MIDNNASLVVEMLKEINRVPRCSKHEEGIANYLADFAKEHGLKSKRDAFNNVLIELPATKGYENRPSVAIQGHMDMVCEKTIDSIHDFSKDPVEVIVDGNWIRSNKTTLGADDGIALAIGCALSVKKDVEHPKIELLFTSDEETGMNGAKNISSGFFESKRLINVDSEKEGVLTVGCAGGEDTDITLPIGFEDSNEESKCYEIAIEGLLSGHSGIDINKNRANSIKLMAELLKQLNDRFGIELAYIEGGSARNAIPKFCRSSLCTKKNIDALRSVIKNFIKEQRNKYSNEKNLKIRINKLDKLNKIIKADAVDSLLGLLNELPCGVSSMFSDKVVETSDNLARVSIDKNSCSIFTSQRSLFDTGLDDITGRIESVAQKYGATCKSYNRYPSWQPNYNSYLLKKGIEVYEGLFFKKPDVEIIHAGLECGIIGSKVRDIDMISIGPTITDPHTPNERVYIPSIEKVWKFIVELLKNI